MGSRDDLELLTYSRLGELMKQFGFETHKSLGQNFVADPNTIERIVRLAGVGPGTRVVEIGPGPGSLTVGLLRAGAIVHAVELDERVIPALRETTGDLATITCGDALTTNFDELLDGEGWVLVSNLPYNIAARVILRLLDDATSIERMVVMTQREVAERMVAPPGSKTYGIPSARVAYHGTAAMIGDISAEVFIPKPRVMSSLLEIVRAPEPRCDGDRDLLFGLIRDGFAQRRKMLRKALSGSVTDAQFVAAGVDPQARAETLGIEAWCALASAVASTP